MNILLTCAGRRNYLAGFFRDGATNPVRIIGADMDACAPALQVCDVAYTVPSVFDPGYARALVDICEYEQVDLVIPLNDHELPVLARSRSAIESTGARLILSSAKVVDMCFDKYESARWLASHKLCTPHTVLTEAEAIDALSIGTMHFPLIVKPRWGSASFSVHEVHSLEELSHAVHLVSARLMREGLAPRSDDGSEHQRLIVIHQKICGKEYGIDVLNNLDGETKSVYVKEKLSMRSGETDRSCLRDILALNQIGSLIGRELAHVGNLDCDVLVEGDVAYVLELNPRFGGGYPFSHVAGANYPGAIMSWLTGESVSYNQFERRFDIVFSKADELLEVKKKALASVGALKMWKSAAVAAGEPAPTDEGKPSVVNAVRFSHR